MLDVRTVLREGCLGALLGRHGPRLLPERGGHFRCWSLLDFLVQNHAAYAQIPADENDYAYLNNHLATMGPSVALLAARPRRSRLSGGIARRWPILRDWVRWWGCLVMLHWMLWLFCIWQRCNNSLHQTRHIVDQLVESELVPITEVLITGGLAKNPVFVKTVADMACHVVADLEEARCHVGGRCPGCAGAGFRIKDVETAMAAMTRPRSTIKTGFNIGAFRRQIWTLSEASSAACSPSCGD